jgi:hypothetical protein
MQASAIGLVIGLALIPAVVFAQAAPPAGAISRDQYIQQAEQRAGLIAGERFDQIDVNHTGYITRGQLRAWAAQQRAAAAARGCPPPQEQ